MPTLRWSTRDEDAHAADRVPYHLLQQETDLGYGDPDTGNMLIQGDNLHILKALLPFYAGRVKCIYIDPPYNTGSAFDHYDDNLDHADWLAMMWPRLDLMRRLLSEDGSIWVSIDDREAHYLKVIMDDIFGRKNFVANVIWEKKYAPANDTKWLSDTHDHILGYAKSKAVWRPRPLPRTASQNALYKNPDDDARGPWMSDNYTCAKSAEERPNLFYEITNPHTGEKIWPKPTRVWAYDRDTHDRHTQENRVYWGQDGQSSTPRLKKFLAELRSKGRVPTTLWKHEDVGHTQDARREVLAFNPHLPFGTPKPEHLIHRLLSIATAPGDLVLDAFLGSGTTAAVAQKMGRRYIGIEKGDHALTHCALRLQKVTDGEQGGISIAQKWQGGGGYRFYRLGSPLCDEEGCLRPGIAFRTLAAYIWFAHTGTSLPPDTPPSPFLGHHNGQGYALLHDSIPAKADNGAILTPETLATLRVAVGDFDGPITVYGERTTLSKATQASERLTFMLTAKASTLRDRSVIPPR